MIKNYDSIAVVGTTAAGKTRLACRLAYEYNGEVLSVDSRQVYKGMDVGTGKDLSEYEVFGERISHHLIDILPAGAKYHVHDFQSDFYKAWQWVTDRQKLPIVCGGTAMYFASLVQDWAYTQVPVNVDFRSEMELLEMGVLLEKLDAYDGNLPFKVDVNSRKRIIRALEIMNYLSRHVFVPRKKVVEINPLVVALYMNSDERKKRINHRLKVRLANGMIEEVEALLGAGLTEEQLKYYGLEYKYVIDLLKGVLSRSEFEFQLSAAIYRYSKQQMLFFKKLEREGLDIYWMDALGSVEKQLEQVNNLWNTQF